MNVEKYHLDRRSFLEFMGVSSAAIAALGVTTDLNAKPETKTQPFVPLKPQTTDDLVLAKGFKYDIFLKWEDKINNSGDKFGINNDYIAFLPISKKAAFMWVNHEFPSAVLLHGKKKNKSKKDILIEQKSVGGSLLKIIKDKNKWVLDKNSSVNMRFDGTTKIPLISEDDIVGTKNCIGTFSNCAGGTTPWQTFLTCEENYQDYYGEVDFNELIKNKRVLSQKSRFEWTTKDNFPPEHYGWVVEINPRTKKAGKLTALGRFAHECATVATGKNMRPVVYLADDANDEHVYKFIGDKVNSLETGSLYVANLQKGEWTLLDRNKNPKLKKQFSTQTELLTWTREAAKTVGATELNRPEDIEINPVNKDVIIALTNNKPKDDYYGSLLKISEQNADPYSLHFKSKTMLVGGKSSGFACPDNLCFDSRGNLWIATDISGSSIGKAPYTEFGNNALFYVPMSGKNKGKSYQVASAPKDAELTGIQFSPDNKSLFLSVQHPGGSTKKEGEWKSNWPEAGKKPRSAVVEISGSALDKVLQL